MNSSDQGITLKELEKKISVSKTKKEISETLFTTLRLGWGEFKRFLIGWFTTPTKKVKNFIDKSLEEFDKKWSRQRWVFK